MKIERISNGDKLVLQLSGRLDTITAPQLEKELAGLNGITDLAFDMAELEYISSAGLRQLLAAQKIMNKQGHMVLRHVSETVREVLEITGFTDIITVED